MVLTHDRLDCLRLNLEMHAAAGSFEAFDHIVLLMNGVSDAHRRGIRDFTSRHPQVKWDYLEGDGSRPAGLVRLQNACVEKYPGAFYVKTDEDVFVPSGWADRMFSAYEAYRNREDLALITPLITNNGFGLHRLLTVFYPDLLAEFRSTFGHEPDAERAGKTWHSPHIAAWANRKFIRLNQANDGHRAVLAAKNLPRFIEFRDSFSVGCIGYDYRHWQKIGGIPPRDEPEWCDKVQQLGLTHVLDCSQIVLHYAFFVQQEWLDRMPLLEEIRDANLPGTRPASLIPPHRLRLLRQLPSIAQRRFTRK